MKKAPDGNAPPGPVGGVETANTTFYLGHDTQTNSFLARVMPT